VGPDQGTFAGPYKTGPCVESVRGPHGWAFSRKTCLNEGP
jgi:hypothetical protein